ncbi:MAG: hypothetical protein R3A51_11420 [Nannocystaceae bacterium]
MTPDIDRDLADSWTLAGRTLRSRLIVGTGKYRDAAETKAALAASGAEIVTVALRRVDLSQRDNLLQWIDRDRYLLLPNTAGCYTADDAVRTLRLARELGIADLVKLEVIGDPKTLLPDNEETLKAARALLDERASRCSPTAPTIRSSAASSRRWLRRGDASGGADRQRPGIRNPHNLRLIVEARQGAGDRRRRGRHRQTPRSPRASRLRRRAHEHRHRQGKRAGANGPGDAPRHHRGAARLPRGPHADLGPRPRKSSPDVGMIE